MIWKYATGDDTLLDLVYKEREEGGQRIRKSESETMEIKRNPRSFITRAPVLIGHTALTPEMIDWSCGVTISANIQHA